MAEWVQIDRPDGKIDEIRQTLATRKRPCIMKLPKEQFDCVPWDLSCNDFLIGLDGVVKVFFYHPRPSSFSIIIFFCAIIFHFHFLSHFPVNISFASFVTADKTISLKQNYKITKIIGSKRYINIYIKQPLHKEIILKS